MIIGQSTRGVNVLHYTYFKPIRAAGLSESRRLWCRDLVTLGLLPLAVRGPGTDSGERAAVEAAFADAAFADAAGVIVGRTVVAGVAAVPFAGVAAGVALLAGVAIVAGPAPDAAWVSFGALAGVATAGAPANAAPLTIRPDFEKVARSCRPRP